MVENWQQEKQAATELNWRHCNTTSNPTSDEVTVSYDGIVREKQNK